MKKLALTIICALAMNGAAFAQGYINYNLSHVDITAQTNATVYSSLFFFGGEINGIGTGGATGSATGTGLIYDYALLYMPNTATPGVGATTVWDGTWSGAVGLGGGSLTATNSNTAGYLNPVQASGDTQVNWANGTTDNIVVVGWSANLGSTWFGVSNILAQLALGNVAPYVAQVGGGEAFFGESAIGYINPALTTPGASIVGSSPTPNGLPIYSLNMQLYLVPVPEPGTMALAGLGGLSLLLFRRRK